MASGRYQQAEFAADLWQVHLGEGTDEYRDPAEFFRRTYLTESLKRAARRRRAAARRHGRRPGRPAPDQLRRRQDALDAGALPPVLRAPSPANSPASTRCSQRPGSRSHPDGEARRPGGQQDLARQPGHQARRHRRAHPVGRARLAARRQEGVRPRAADDEKATSPGDVLRELFNEYGPCLILIDEWVAYARQLHDQSDLPAGGFETQFTFAQALTESAKLAKNCLLVISLPASDNSGSPHTPGGRRRGRRHSAGARRSTGCATWSGGVESSWRPATAEEGFEIVRRRLFEPLAEPDAVQGARRRRARLRRPLPGPARRSSRPSAATPTTRSGSRPPTRSTPRSSTGSTPTGRRW